MWDGSRLGFGVTSYAAATPGCSSPTTDEIRCVVPRFRRSWFLIRGRRRVRGRDPLLLQEIAFSMMSDLP